MSIEVTHLQSLLVIAAAIRAAEAAMKEQCCKAVCVDCANGIPLIHGVSLPPGSATICHADADNGFWTQCHARAIRDLP